MADKNKEEIEDKIPRSNKKQSSSGAADPQKKKENGKYLGILSTIHQSHKKNSTLSVAICIVLILGVAAYTVAYFVSKYHQKGTSKEQTLQYTASYYPLPDLKLSIKRSDDNLGYLIIGLTLKISSDIKPEELRKKEPEILDMLHAYFASITLDSLSASSATSLISPVGLERLRQNLIKRLNTTLSPIKIESILFRKLITQ